MQTILIVEDEEAVRENLVELLEAEGFRAMAAENGQEGLALARAHHPDLILCDVLMPELDGYGVLAALRADPATVAIPFIFLTARAGHTDRLRAAEIGAETYLTKPFTRRELLTVIRGCLGNTLGAKVIL